MSDNSVTSICVIIGASHAGASCAFALRSEGWLGRIIIYDTDAELPYHRPPLSKTYLTAEQEIASSPLKSAESYEREDITLKLGIRVSSIDRNKKRIYLKDGATQTYDKLVLATGARPIIPPVSGLEDAQSVFALRTLADVEGIRKALGNNAATKKVVVIGGGYIGLEIAASLTKLGSKVTVLERQKRILERVTSVEMSNFFSNLHTENRVRIATGKNVTSVEQKDIDQNVICSDGSAYPADIILIGVGIYVNQELAEKAGIVIGNGIKVDGSSKTSDTNIYAIGDCTNHHNPHYDKAVRLESVQNAVDQAKVAAAAICGKEAIYDAIPWFWSDQYDVKLQIVGLSEGYDNYIVRQEEKEGHCFSIWYFNGDKLLSVDAVNNAKAYVLGTRFIKTGQLIDKEKLANSTEAFKPANLVVA